MDSLPLTSSSVETEKWVARARGSNRDRAGEFRVARDTAHHRWLSDGEVKETTKMGCSEDKEARGGSVTARVPLWKCGDSERWPAMGVTW